MYGTNFWWIKTYFQIALGCQNSIPNAILFNLDDARLGCFWINLIFLIHNLNALIGWLAFDVS